MSARHPQSRAVLLAGSLFQVRAQIGGFTYVGVGAHRPSLVRVERTDSNKAPPPVVDIGRLRQVIARALCHVLGATDFELDDLQQEATEAILTALRGGRFREDCPFSVWAAAIARNIAIDALRARSRDRRLFARDPVEDDGPLQHHEAWTVQPMAEVRSDVIRVDRALAGMPPSRARLICLHDGLGFELREIAEMTGLSVAATQSRLVRARRTIVRSMQRPSGSLGFL